jgi:tyrosine-protein kinase Etk/Wzc
VNISSAIASKDFKPSISIKDYITIIVRRKYTIIISLLSVLLSTIAFVYKIEDSYESFSTIVIEEKSAVMNQVMNVGGRDLSFYQGILYSHTFLDLLIDSIGMNIFKANYPNIPRNNIRELLIANLSLQRTSYTSFLRLNVKAKTPQLSYLLASLATDLFQKRCRDVESEESRNALLELENQLKSIRSNLEKAEYEYRTYKDQRGDILEGMTPELKTLQNAYAESFAQLGLKQADLNAEKGQLIKLEAIITPQADIKTAPESVKLRSRLNELEKERIRLENLGIRLSSTSTIDREINEIEKQLLQYKRPTSEGAVNANTIQQWQSLRKSVLNKEAEMGLFKRRLDSYQRAILNYKKENPDILSQSLELQRLKRSKEVYENIYNILLQKTEEQRIVSTSSGSGIKIVDIARFPENPIPKNETRYYIVGIIMGLVLGLFLVFMMEFNDTSLKSNEDIEHYMNIPVLGTIPHIVYSKKDDIKVNRQSSKTNRAMSVRQYPKQLINFTSDESITAEAFRSLRTNLSFVSPDNPIRTLILSSAGPSEGKSLTIANLSLSYAQMGKKTLLVDTDLRRPVQHHIFGMKREPGFSDLFAEIQDYSTIIRKTQHENLFLVTAGMFTPNPAELLGSNKMKTLIDYFKQNFDIVFFDTPPIVAVTDSVLLGTKVDGLLFVIRSQKTSREAAIHAINSLKTVGTKCFGAVLNDINLSNHYSSYGYYKYYYHYYKSKT